MKERLREMYLTLVRVNHPRENEVAYLEKHMQAFDAVLAQIPAWNPMATAPRDGSWVLLRCPSGYGGQPGIHVALCSWREDRDDWYTDLDEPFYDGAQAPTGWLPLP